MPEPGQWMSSNRTTSRRFFYDDTISMPGKGCNGRSLPIVRYNGPRDIMLTKPIQSILLLVILGLLASSCISAALSPKDAAFDKLIPLAGMNSKLEFIALDTKDSPYRIGTSIALGLKNLTDFTIIFPSNYGLQIFAFQDNEWSRIDNLMQYIPEGNTQISPKGPDTPGQTGVDFFPDLKNEGQPIEIRVVIQGIVYVDEMPTDEQASAYIDIVLQP